MKKAFFALLLICISTTLLGSTPKKLFPVVVDGGTIDADYLNQITKTVENDILGFQSPDELLGTWECKNITLECAQHVGTLDSGIANTGLHDNGGLTDHGWYQTRTQTVVFSKDTSDVYRHASSENLLTGCWDRTDLPITGRFTVMNNMILFINEKTTMNGEDALLESSTQKGPFMYSLVKMSDTQFNIQITISSIASCTKQNVPPDIPTALQVGLNTDSTTDVKLTWSDNTTTETGFKVLRRTIDATSDAMEKIPDYEVITTTGANTTEFIDKTCKGNCYYKIKAVNEHGEKEASSNVASFKKLK